MSQWRLLAAFIFSTQIQTASSQTPPKPDSASASDFDVEVSCSDTKPGVSRAVLTWHTPPGSVPSGRGPGARPQSEIDVATSDRGFEEGTYMTVWPSRTPASSKKGPGGPSNGQFNPLQQLRVVAPGPGAGRAASTSAGGPSTVQAEGLEAGVNYFWRVRVRTADGWAPSIVVKVRGRACPVDNATRSPKR